MGYYRQSYSRYRLRTIQTDGYIQYEFEGSNNPTSVNLKIANNYIDERQPLTEFTVGKYVLNH